VDPIFPGSECEAQLLPESAASAVATSIISVAVSLAILLVTGAAIYLFMQKRHRKAQISNSAASENENSFVYRACGADANESECILNNDSDGEEDASSI